MPFRAEIHLSFPLSPVPTLSSGYGVSWLVSSFEFLDLDFLKARRHYLENYQSKLYSKEFSPLFIPAAGRRFPRSVSAPFRTQT